MHNKVYLAVKEELLTLLCHVKAIAIQSFAGSEDAFIKKLNDAYIELANIEGEFENSITTNNFKIGA